ncbi:hypothetical protein BY996DRAFT_6413749 [Phakopsora pachyrhizi]|nr:hypothetical protein BY996DRAFT_6413749 [Phakopsora pachyrhizi]
MQVPQTKQPIVLPSLRPDRLRTKWNYNNDCRAAYYNYAYLLSLDGASWDNSSHTVTLSDLIWNRLKDDEASKRLYKLKDKPFPIFWKMCSFVKSSTDGSESIRALSAQRKLLIEDEHRNKDNRRSYGSCGGASLKPASEHPHSIFQWPTVETNGSILQTLPISVGLPKTRNSGDSGSNKRALTAELVNEQLRSTVTEFSKRLKHIQETDSPIEPKKPQLTGIKDSDLLEQKTAQQEAIIKAQRSALDQNEMVRLIDKLIENEALAKAYLVIGSSLEHLWLQNLLKKY